MPKKPRRAKKGCQCTLCAGLEICVWFVCGNMLQESLRRQILLFALVATLAMQPSDPMLVNELPDQVWVRELVPVLYLDQVVYLSLP